MKSGFLNMRPYGLHEYGLYESDKQQGRSQWGGGAGPPGDQLSEKFFFLSELL